MPVHTHPCQHRRDAGLTCPTTPKTNTNKHIKRPSQPATKNGMRAHIRNEFTELSRELNKKPAGKKPSTQIVRHRSNNMTQAVNFAGALQHPFNPMANGVQVPDIYSFPTATFHSHGVFNLSSATQGTLGVCVMPNPIASVIDMCLDSNSYTCVTSTSMVQLGSSDPLWGAVAPTTLQSVLSSYRVASWGIKITNLQPALTATGRLFIAVVPSLSVVPSYQALTSQGPTNGAGYFCKEFNNANYFSSDILDLPISREVSISELMTGAIQIAPSAVNPVFYTFKGTQSLDQTTTTQYFGDSISGTAGGVLGTPGLTSLTNMTGGCNVIIYGEGFPTSSSNLLAVEFVYHLEGTPVVNLAGISGGANQPLQGSSNTVEVAMIASPPSRSITFLDAVSAISTSATKVAQSAANFASSPIGRGLESALFALF